MVLPTPLAFTLAQPWILYKGKLYQPNTKGTLEDYIELHSLRIPLVEIETPKRLEDHYLRIFDEEIRDVQAGFLQQVTRTLYQSKESLEKSLGENKILSLLISKVLPVITQYSVDDQLASLIEQEQEGVQRESFLDLMVGQQQGRSPSRVSQTELQRQKERLQSQVVQEYARYERQLSRATPQQSSIINQLSAAIEREQTGDRRNESILASQIIFQRDVMIHQGLHELIDTRTWASYFEKFFNRGWYQRISRIPSNQDPRMLFELMVENKEKIEKRYLSRFLNKLVSSHVKIDGNYLFPIFMQDDRIDDMITHYQKLMEKQIKLHALDHHEFQTIQLEEIAKQRQQLSTLVNLDHFDLNNAGFKKADGGYYVYVHTPSYALRSPHLRTEPLYQIFPPAKIGVLVSQYHGNFSVGSPVVMNKYKHPFLPRNNGMGKICLGAYNPESARNVQPEETIFTLLSKSKENLLMGYRTGSNPHVPLTRDRWNNWKTKAEIDRMGLICLNDFTGDRHG